MADQRVLPRTNAVRSTSIENANMGEQVPAQAAFEKLSSTIPGIDVTDRTATR
jgi:hypothetical protein